MHDFLGHHRLVMRQLGRSASRRRRGRLSSADLDRIVPRHFPLSLTDEAPPTGADAPHTNRELNVIVSGSAGGILPPHLRQKQRE